MNRTQAINAILAFTCICNVAFGDVKVAEAGGSTKESRNRLYDCGANVLYVYAALGKNPKTYAECLKMLPPREDGNSAFEMLNALKACGVVAFGWKATPDEVAAISSPAILLIYPPKDDQRAVRHDIGHFLIVRPVGRGMLQIMDPPSASNIVPAAIWGDHLNKKQIDDIILITQESLPIVAHVPSMRAVAAPLTRLSITGVSTKPIVGYHDLGHVEEGTISKYVFTIINQTEHPVKIIKITSGCSCTKISCNREVLGKNEEAEVSVSIDHQGKAGVVSEGVVVRYDMAGTNQILHVQIGGQITPSWVCEPSAVLFGRIDKTGGPVQREMVIRAESDRVKRSRKAPVVYSDDRRVKLEVKRTPEEGVYRCLITIDPAKCITPLTARIQVSVGPNAWAASSCTVIADTSEPVQVTPERVLMRKSGRVFRSVNAITVRSIDGNPTTIESVNITGVNKEQMWLVRSPDDKDRVFVELEASEDMNLCGEMHLEGSILGRRFDVACPVVITP